MSSLLTAALAALLDYAGIPVVSTTDLRVMIAEAMLGILVLATSMPPPSR